MQQKSDARRKRIERAGSKPEWVRRLENEVDGEQGPIWMMGFIASFIVVLAYIIMMGLISIPFNPGLGEENPADWFWQSWLWVGGSVYALWVGTLSFLPMITRFVYSPPHNSTRSQVEAAKTFQGYTEDEKSIARPVYLEFLLRDPNFASLPYEKAGAMWDRMETAISKRRELYAEQEALDTYDAQHALASIESHNRDLAKELQERQI